MAEPPPIGMSATDWTLEQTRALLRLAQDPESFKEVDKVTQIIAGLMNGTLWSNREAARDELLVKIQETLKTVGDTIGAPLGAVMNTLYGVNYIGGSFGTIASGGGTVGARKAAGDSIVSAIFDIFNLPGVKAGFQSRTPGIEEQENFARFVGMNWQIQMADLIAEMTSHWVPWEVLGGVREIGDKVQKVLGLEDAQEEIMEPLMEKLIIVGLEKRFNRETLPTDLSLADAIDAHIRGQISRAVLDMIFANEGVRADIRDILISLKAKNLSESDFRDLYQRGLWSPAQVKTGFVSNGYLDDDATSKTALIVQDRLYRLIGEQENTISAQAVKGVIATAEYEAFLRNNHWLPDEVAVMIDIVERKKTLQTITAAKKVTGSFNVAPWRVKPGASAMMSWNIRNADDVTISGIGTVPARGERVIQPDISQTYTLTASNDLGSETFQAAVQVGATAELKRPTISFSAAPGRVTIGMPVELKWSTTNADSVSIDGVGAVAEAGAVAVYPFQATIYTIRASNAQGTTIRQDIVFVSLPDIDLEKERRPAIAFSVTPGVVKTKQPQTELTWRLTRAESGTLEFPDGSKRDVGRNGALIFTATASGIFTLKANNLFGETQNQQAVIFEGGEEEEPPPPPGTTPPALTLSVSPQTAAPSENLFVFWNIAGATVGTLVTPDGNNRTVGASGNENYAAPAGAGSYEFRLTATNDAGPSSQSVVIVVSAL